MARGSKDKNARVSGGASADNRTPDALVRDIEAARDRLADTIDEIVDRTNPKNVARRTLGKVRARFIDEDGAPRMENIAPVAGAVVGVGVLIVVVRRLVGRD